MKNRIIKRALFENDLKQHELAKVLGMHEASLSRKLREDLPEAEQLEIVGKLNEYLKNHETEAHHDGDQKI